MIAPFCSICLRSGVLCPACERKIKDQNQVSQFDYDVCRYLNEKFIDSNVEYVSSFLAGNVAILFMKGSVGAVIGREGSGARELSAKLGKRIKIINADSDMKNTISGIINPLELLGINTLFKNGVETCKIRVSKKNFAHISFDITSLEKILANLMKKQVMISFE